MTVRLKKKIEFKTTFDTYIADEVIGQGGNGKVYKASDESGNIWAIKSLDPTKISKEKLKRFKNEYLFCSKNQHENILSVTDYGLLYENDKSTPFYVMPKYECSLRELMNKGINHQDILRFFSQILNGIEAAHLFQVVHRDLKPENILFDVNRNILVIADFGIARFAEEEMYTIIETSPRSRLANFQYAAPEQRKVDNQVDHRADIYSLGLILNEMFTGEIPQGTKYKTIETIDKENQYLDEIISNMISQSPNERPSSIMDVKKQLIGRKNDYINFQKVSELKKIIIPTSEIDDPLILNPPILVDASWDNNFLTLKLSQPVNSNWKWALQNMGSYSSVLGKGPESFNINGDTVTINCYSADIQIIIDYFKSWLPNIQNVYENKIRKDIRNKENEERAKLKSEIEKQELKEKVNRNIKI